MENKEQTLKKRNEKLIKFFKDKHNLLLVLLLSFAIIIRLYYFFLTKDQAVWWDAGEYMSMARAWAFNLEYEFLPVRPVLLSLITAICFKIYYSEFLPRLLILGLSISSVYGMYLLGKEIYSKKTGLIAATLMSASYLSLFHTYRLLVDLPSLTFFIFSALFFYKYFKYNSNKMLYYGAITIAIGVLFRITTATFLIAIAIYVLVLQKLSFLKKKEIWISAIIFWIVLSPYIIWGYLQFNGFVLTLAGGHNAPAKGTFISNGISNMISYIKLFPLVYSWPVLIFFIIGLIFMYKFFLGLDLIILKKTNKVNKELFLLLIFLIPIISVSFSIGNHYYEDRYIMNSLPAVFIIASFAVIKTYHLIKKNSKLLAILFIIIFLIASMYPQLKYADTLIKYQKDSFKEFKTSGIWLRDNSEPNEKIITSSWPMTGYYAERSARGFVSTKEEFEELRSSDPNLKYFIVSAIQSSPEWTYTYPQENNLTIIQAYFADQAQQQPILVIYRLD